MRITYVTFVEILFVHTILTEINTNITKSVIFINRLSRTAYNVSKGFAMDICFNALLCHFNFILG